MNVVDEIPEPHRSALVAVLRRDAPDLLRALRAGTAPDLNESRAVSRTLSRAMSAHYGPGHEPDETGKAIDNALGAFLTRWPQDELARHSDL